MQNVPSPDTAVPTTSPTPDEDVFSLGERCAEAFRQADVLKYEGLVLLAEFDVRKGYEESGFTTTADWLTWRTDIEANAARERVRTARALQHLPKTAAAMRDGALSFTKVRTLTRVAKPENEEQLLTFARAGSAANLQRLVKGWKQLDRRSEATAEQIRFRSRTFRAFVADDGMVVLKGRLDPEAGAVLMRAIEAASDALYREEDESDEREAQQRRADALGLLAERALALGFGEGAPISGSRTERTQVMLHVDAETLSESGEPGISELEDGTRVSAETARRMACDTGVVEVTVDDPDSPGRHRGSRRCYRSNNGATDRAEGLRTNVGATESTANLRTNVLDAGRRTRTVPPALRRALEVRDRGCRYPGCGLRFTDAHHIQHWADGGETSLRNLVLLCRRHHRAAHEGGMRVCMDRNQKVVFLTPRGRALTDAAPMLPRRRLRAPNQTPLAQDVIPRYKRDIDIPWSIEGDAWDALDSD